MHWWHNVACEGDLTGPTAAGVVACKSVTSGTWPGSYGKKSYAGPGSGDGYWGSWAWATKAIDLEKHRITFGTGGSQTTRGALNAGPWYVEGIKQELDQLGEFYHSQKEQNIYWMPNVSSADFAAGALPVATASVLSTLVAVRGTKTKPASNILFEGFTLANSAPTYTQKVYPTCGGGDFCAARIGVASVTGGVNVTLSKLTIDHAGGNGIAVLDYNRGVTVSDSVLRHIGEVGIVVQGSTNNSIDTIGAGSNYPQVDLREVDLRILAVNSYSDLCCSAPPTSRRIPR